MRIKYIYIPDHYLPTLAPPSRGREIFWVSGWTLFIIMPLKIIKFNFFIGNLLIDFPPLIELVDLSGNMSYNVKHENGNLDNSIGQRLRPPPYQGQ
jgi:hypothetical protein